VTYKQQGGPLTRDRPKRHHPDDALSIPLRGDGRRVVDLATERRRRLLRDLRLGPTVPVPCKGVCRCWHTPLGGAS
jgi:hypothetical protein